MLRFLRCFAASKTMQATMFLEFLPGRFYSDLLSPIILFRRKVKAFFFFLQIYSISPAEAPVSLSLTGVKRPELHQVFVTSENRSNQRMQSRENK